MTLVAVTFAVATLVIAAAGVVLALSPSTRRQGQAFGAIQGAFALLLVVLGAPLVAAAMAITGLGLWAALALIAPAISPAPPAALAPRRLHLWQDRTLLVQILVVGTFVLLVAHACAALIADRAALLTTHTPASLALEPATRWATVLVATLLVGVLIGVREIIVRDSSALPDAELEEARA